MQYFYTGETPRRSARISGKSKATDAPESETPRKRQNLSSSKNGSRGKRDDADEEGETVEEIEDTLVGEETKTIEVEMKEADDLGEKSKEEVSTEDAAIPVCDREVNPKCEEKDVKKDEIDVEKNDHQGTDNETTSNPKEINTDINLLSIPSANEEGQKQAKEPEALQNEGLEDNEEGEKQLIEPESGNKGLEDVEEGEEKQTEESAPPSKLEINKEDETTISDDSKKKVGSISHAASGPEDGGEGGAEKHLIGPEAPSSLPVHDDAVSTVKEVKTLNEILPDADAKVEKESDEVKENKDSLNKELSMGKSPSVGETKVINDILKEGQDGSTPLDNHSDRTGGDTIQ